jgi:hypothetical protein
LVPEAPLCKSPSSLVVKEEGKSQEAPIATDSQRVSIAVDNINAVDPQRIWASGNVASSLEPCHAGNAVQQEALHRQIAYALEAVLVLGACVEGIQRGTEVLELILKGVDLTTSADALEAYLEIGGLQPFVCDDIFGVLRPACLLIAQG